MRLHHFFEHVRRILIVATSLAACYAPLIAQWKSIGAFSSFSPVSKSSYEFVAAQGKVQISFLAEDVVRIRATNRSAFLPDQSVAVAQRDWMPVDVGVRELPAEIRLTSRQLVVVVKKNPIRLSFLDFLGNTITEDDSSKGMMWDGDEGRVWKMKPPDEYYYGLGEKAGRFARNDKSYSMWNSDVPAYGADTDPLYQSIPFFYGVRKGRAYGVFFDNTFWSSFEFGKEARDRYSFGALGGEINYYFFAGSKPQQVLSRFTELVGRMPLPPKWSLGYQQCRWSYTPESRVREIAKNFRDRNIPCDAIYLDIDYMEGYRIFTFNQKNFPQPKQLISDLARNGFKIVVIVDPGIKADSTYHAFQSGIKQNVFLTHPSGKLYLGKVWPGVCAFPDFSHPTARTWWGENFKVLIDAGVRGFWNDMNEPSVFDVPTKTVDLDVKHYDDGNWTPHVKNHNTYGMLMTQATYEGVRKLRPDERPFVLTRASYAGGWKYSSAWTGDNVSSWDHLAMALSMCLGISMSGQPFVGSDIGGFIGTPSGELMARWLQLGVFTPLMRAHSVINSINKEPWEFGTEFEQINRETIRLRYRFLPYIYTTMVRASQKGVPAMQPLVFAYPDDARFAENDTEFMFGDDVLVAPVLWPGMKERALQLPQGAWYDFWTNTRYEGGRSIKVDAPPDRLPLFVRAGAIIPMQASKNFVGEFPSRPVTLQVYPSTEGTSQFYDDDGISFQYEKGKYFKRKVEQTATPGRLSIKLSEAEGTYVPLRKTVLLAVVDVNSEPKQVRWNSQSLSRAKLNDVFAEQQGWAFDFEKKILFISIAESRETSTYEITWK
ncbi:MAG: DUF4968 domain-containing protein [Ignavibacteriales bacterium]|nr:DUF4968 domain-containing protein [Ignavibacteriales bacterium]